jgi:hypothetical protein
MAERIRAGAAWCADASAAALADDDLIRALDVLHET